ncbi:MAG: AMP-binding protein [Candidatus Latescibacteria bacterium]|nr:AMP-binding protein [Candidatus Latescibacterota bacterium]
MDIVGNRTLSGIFSRFAVYHPDKTYLIFEDFEGHSQQWSFAQCEERTNRTARWLLAIGIKRGESFTFHAPNSPAFVVLAIAASRIGAIMVPTDYRATVNEVSYIVDHSESRLIITEPEQLNVVQAVASAVSRVQEVVLSLPVEDRYGETDGHPIFEREIERQETTPPDVATGADDVVHILYTSGTTSRPKGVLLTNKALIYGAEVFVRASGLRNDDRHLITLPLFHAAAQCHAFWPSLVCGAGIVVAPRFSPTRFLGLAIRHQCTMAALFSAPLRMLLAQPHNEGWQAHRLRNVTFAIALTEEQFDEWDRRFGAPLQHLWGMTETVGLPLMSPLYGKRHLPAMGRPVLGYEVKVIDNDGNELHPGEVGQIIVSADPGRTVMKGYFKNPRATEETIHDGWLYTGDNAFYDEEGFYYFVDRRKDMIKRGGENIAPSEVEAMIKELNGVADVAVIGVPDPVYDEVPKAFVILQPGVILSPKQILDHCQNKLTAFKVPVSVTFSQEFPRTSVGKIQKHLLRRQEQEIGDRRKTYDLPPHT